MYTQKQANNFLWCSHLGQAGVFLQNQDKYLAPACSNWLQCYKASPLPLVLLTGSSHASHIISQNTFHVQLQEEPRFPKSSGGVHKAECDLWFQDVVMLETDTQPHQNKSLARFMEPDFFVN